MRTGNPSVSLARKLWRFSISVMGLRRSDVWLASFPRSGSTWMRMILCNIISLCELGHARVDYHTLGATMPSLGRNNLLKPWRHKILPRIVKTHQPYRSILFSAPDRTVYILRDPRDVMVSYYHLMQNIKRGPYKGGFRDFIRDGKYGMPAYLKHYHSWLHNITAIVRYEDLMHDPIAETNKLLCALRVSVPAHILEHAIELSEFSRVRKVQAEFGIPQYQSELFRNPDVPVARKGKVKQWIHYFSEEDIAYYKELRMRYGFEEY